jgi:diadenosine tetraphosphatase ApaH/serine/threonine PP2A family protein phosphatase
VRALIVSDVHSNLEAFESVIADAEMRGGFDRIWSLGDLVGYGPDPGACIDLMRKYDHVGVAGNHDLAAYERLSTEAFNVYAAAAVDWTMKELTTEHIDYLNGLPLGIEVDGFTLVHGSPRDPVWEYVVTVATATVSFHHFDTPRCLVGHSHISFICTPTEKAATFLEFPLDKPISLADQRAIVNPGGLGQPRDGDPRASYAIYDAEGGSVTHHRVEYDIGMTQEKMLERGLPQYLADRLTHGR